MSDKAKIKQQVEFYFSDSNLRRDVFLKAAIEKDNEKFVPIDIILTFKRLQALTTDAEVVAEALKDSTQVEVSSCGSKIRRVNKLDPVDTSKERTLYAKGYPIDDEDVSIENITEIFSVYGKVLMVRLRRSNDKSSFRGSLFVEFDKEEEMRAAVAAAHTDGKVSMKYKETELLCVMPLGDWLARKQEKKAKRTQQTVDKKRKVNDISTNDGETGAKEEDSEPSFTPGLILKVGNIPADASFTQIKDFFGALGDVRFVDYTAGNTYSFIRFSSVETVETIKAVLEKGVPLVAGGENLTHSSVTGEEEKEYWRGIEKDMKNKKLNKGKGKGGRGGGRGGRGFKKARKSY